MRDYAILGLVALGTYGLRSSFIAFAGSRRLPPLANRVLEQIKPAILAALTVTALVGHGEVRPEHLAAVAVAGVIAWRGGDLILVLVGGMLTFALSGLVL